MLNLQQIKPDSPVVYKIGLKKGITWASGIFRTLLDKKKSSPEDYAIIDVTDQRVVDEGHRGGGVILSHTYSVPLELLTGRMSERQVREHLASAPDVDEKDEHINGIVGCLDLMVENYIPAGNEN